MASAGTVTLNLDANSVKLLRELQKSERASRRTATHMRKQFVDAFKAVAAASVAAGAAFAALTKRSINAQDRLSKLAQTTGVSTEALSQLEFAAKLSGTSLEGLQTGLLRLSRTASDAANGLSTAQRAFNAIGVSAKNQDGTLKNTEQLLLEVAEQFAGLEDGAGKAAVAQELFGRSGAQLIPFLNQGKDGIEALRAEADRLGLTIGTDAAQAAERFNDNLTRVQSAAQGLIAQSTQRLLPTIEAISDRFVETVSSTDGMTRAVDTLEAAFKTLISTGMVVAGVFRTVGTLAGATAAAIVQRNAGIIRMAVEDLRSEATDTIENIASMWGAAVERAATEVEEPAARIRRALNFGAAEEGGESPAEKMSDEAKRAAQIIEQTRSDFERYAEALNEAHALWKSGLLDEDTFRRFVDQLEQMYDHAVEVTEEATETMSVYAEQAARNMQDVFADFLFDPFDKGLKGMLRGFIDTMRRMASQAAASRIFDAIPGGGIGGFLGGIFGGGKASGGPVSGGTTYLVGERGPELFTPSTSGQIIPNHAMGGGDIIFQIDARGADAQLTRALPAILEQQAQRIKADIATSRSRGRSL